MYTLLILTHSAQGPPYLMAQHQAPRIPARLRYPVVHPVVTPAAMLYRYCDWSTGC
ncbi:MAG: hypothetical protein M0R28_18665 [Pigmentiphaga sp.]|nr:hypothetical protein [Pigmentiphaga sp.]